MENTVTIKEYKVPKNRPLQITAPTFWLKKYGIKVVSVIELPNGDIILRKKVTA